jgi:hypothetical protein
MDGYTYRSASVDARSNRSYIRPSCRGSRLRLPKVTRLRWREAAGVTVVDVYLKPDVIKVRHTIIEMKDHLEKRTRMCMKSGRFRFGSSSPSGWPSPRGGLPASTSSLDAEERTCCANAFDAATSSATRQLRLGCPQRTFNHASAIETLDNFANWIDGVLDSVAIALDDAVTRVSVVSRVSPFSRLRERAWCAQTDSNCRSRLRRARALLE